jgi:hypothetical protein
LQTSYDSAWLEHHGVPVAGGFFELPTVAARRRHEEIPSRKRAQYRRRYEMLDLLDAQIGAAVSAA